MAAKPHREYDSCRASIVTAECCLSTALKYHGLDQIPMAIIRYCGSEPKVNQCLNISFSCWIAKASFFPCSLYLVWIKNEHLKLTLLHFYLFFYFFCVALGGSLNAGFVFLTEFIICRRRRQAKVWPWGDSLNQTNDRPIMRTVFVKISLCQYQ